MDVESQRLPLWVFRRAKLQWGHVLLDVERGCSGSSGVGCGSGFNGATSCWTWRVLGVVAKPQLDKWLQWGHVLLDVERRGAGLVTAGSISASMGPRPVGRGEVSWTSRLCAADCASMGPRPVGRGEDAIIARGRPFTAGFNGATSCWTWRERAPPTRRGRQNLLQWGHVLLDVERRQPRAWLPAHVLASMGPRPVGRGELGSKDGALTVFLLQWGHVLLDVERSTGDAAVCSGTPASMGPRPVGRGERA